MNCRPSVSRHVLFVISAGLWMVAGAVLCVRGIQWLGEAGVPVGLLLGIGSVIAGIVFYVQMFSRVVRRNIDRINRLPDRPCIFAFTGTRGYVVIGVMMATGYFLRHSGVPGLYLSLPYSAMGGALLAGSTRFCREFIRVRNLNEP